MTTTPNPPRHPSRPWARTAALVRLAASLAVLLGVLVMHGLMPSGSNAQHDVVHLTTTPEQLMGAGGAPAMTLRTLPTATDAVLAVLAMSVAGPAADARHAPLVGTSTPSHDDSGHSALAACLAVLGALALGWLVSLGLRRRLARPLLARPRRWLSRSSATGPPPLGHGWSLCLSLCVIRV